VAEFQDVMRQLGRICASNFGECDICDLRPFCPSKTFLDKYEKSGRVERLEKMVMAWAAEHPKSVYPTWYEYLFNVTRGENKWPVDDHEFCQWLDTMHIPADIAQKLGIEPKDG
jgi:hypothetical protein